LALGRVISSVRSDSLTTARSCMRSMRQLGFSLPARRLAP
jgi:hypothetical protein